jgi:biotin operon repressor
MLFERRLRDGIHDGRITLAFRRWQRCQARAGHRYRTGLDLVEVEAVDVVTAADVDAAQAGQAGFSTVQDLLGDIPGAESLPLYRVRLRRLDEPDPRDELARAAALTAAEVTAVAARLARMDASSPRGPWTSAVLAQIARRPATSSVLLAEDLGWPRPDFKVHVRRLKELGLTISLDVGYRLSPRGEAYLRAAEPVSRPTGRRPAGRQRAPTGG